MRRPNTGESHSDVIELREQLLEAERELAALPDLRAAAEEREYLARELARSQAQLGEAVAEVEGQHGVIARMASSVSWRVTRPLRALKRRLR